MAMNLTPGEIYFISERDHLSGTLSGYYKIGLVKSSRRGDSRARLAEHQTGNPRHLEVEHIVEAPAVSTLEVALHQRLALKRVSGEWFQLTPRALAQAIAMASNLAADQRSHLRSFARAEALGGELSTERLGRATARDLNWFERAQVAKLTLRRLKQVQGSIKEFLSEALDAGQPVVDFIGSTETESATFDKQALRRDHPDLFDEYAGTKPSASKLFRLAGGVEGPDVVVPRSVESLARQVEELLSRPSTKRSYLEELHACHLSSLAHSSKAEWDQMIATAELQVRCGTKAGISGICSWKRVESSAPSFDLVGFRRAHPRLAEKYMVLRVRRSFGVIPMRSYVPKR